MTKHTWAIEEVDGGPIGSDDVYRCTACGCCGGGTEHVLGGDREPRAFLPGAALDLSEDCDVAHEQISYFVRGYLHHWMIRNIGKKDERQLIALFKNAEKYTPREMPRVEFYHLLFECADPLGRQRYTDDEIKAKLVGTGFKLVSTTCTQCGKPTDRDGDDPKTLCYQCSMQEAKAKCRGSFGLKS